MNDHSRKNKHQQGKACILSVPERVCICPPAVVDEVVDLSSRFCDEVDETPNVELLLPSGQHVQNLVVMWRSSCGVRLNYAFDEAD